MNHYRSKPQFRITFDEELIIDNFAGGGGASTGMEAAIGRPVDVAVNHDADAIAMHMVNHPSTKHYCEDVFHVNPREVAQGRPVGLAWFSPDCKHHSKARGGKPVDKNIRGLAWVALRWAASVRPRVIILENVEEFQDWGPLVDDRPDPARKGETFDLFVDKRLRRLGYQVEHRILRASDYGTPTIRKRLFLVARCDGQPIVWPAPTHGDPSRPGFKKSGLKPWRTAASIIDWSLPCPSIFGRRRPLAENTLRRIARGIQKFVLDNPQPFIVRICQQGFGGDGMQYSTGQPLTTITTKAEHCLVAPIISPYYGPKPGADVRGAPADTPLQTVTAENRHALCCAFLAKHFGGNYQGAGADLEQPLPTVTAVDHNALVAAHLINLKGSDRRARAADAPAPAICAGGTHIGEVRAFLIKFYSEGGQWAGLNEPMHTIPTKDRLGLVTIHGEQYQIVDIGMRMLEPRELFAAQGFPPDYVIDVDAKGNNTPKYKQVARCGNSVCPPLAEALVRANYKALQLNRSAA